jgi:hypothetical protein
MTYGVLICFSSRSVDYARLVSCLSILFLFFRSSRAPCLHIYERRWFWFRGARRRRVQTELDTDHDHDSDANINYGCDKWTRSRSREAQGQRWTRTRAVQRVHPEEKGAHRHSCLCRWSLQVFPLLV